jgi:hypothetical protein
MRRERRNHLGPAQTHCSNAEQLMALAMSVDPRTSPIQPCKLSVLLTFIMAKDT